MEISRIASHKKSVHKKVRYNCDMCSSNLANKRTLVNHVKVVHNGDKFKGKCSLCTYEANFSHRKSVYDKVIYNCDKCSSNFVKKSTLIDHIKVVHYGGTRGPKKMFLSKKGAYLTKEHFFGTPCKWCGGRVIIVSALSLRVK